MEIHLTTTECHLPYGITVLPSTRHKRTHPAFTPARQAGTRLVASTPVRTAHMCVVHNTALNSSDNLPSYDPDNHHSSDDVCWRRRERLSVNRGPWSCTRCLNIYCVMMSGIFGILPRKGKFASEEQRFI